MGGFDQVRVRFWICVCHLWTERPCTFISTLPPKLDVCPTPRHIGRDGDRAELARVSDYLRFLFVLTRIQNVVRQGSLLFSISTEEFGFFDRGGAHENRLPFCRWRFFISSTIRFVFLCCSAVDTDHLHRLAQLAGWWGPRPRPSP